MTIRNPKFRITSRTAEVPDGEDDFVFTTTREAMSPWEAFVGHVIELANHPRYEAEQMYGGEEPFGRNLMIACILGDRADLYMLPDPFKRGMKWHFHPDDEDCWAHVIECLG